MKKIYFYTLLLGLLAFTACEDEKSPVMELQKASAFEPFSQSDFTFNDENAAAGVSRDQVDGSRLWSEGSGEL